jgi:hypothetical protein
MYTREEYEAKRQARYERLQAAAEKAGAESKAALTQAHDMASVIPFGQPILIGHHSEGRDRRYRGRIEAKHRKGFELLEKQEYYRERAQAAEQNRAIFSDDPAAVEKLEDKLARLEKRQELMKAANKLIKKNDRAGLALLGFSDERIEDLFKPDYMGRVGFPSYAITNNGANIRQVKERIKTVAARQAMDTTEEVINGVTIEVNPGENRIRMYFKGKPPENIRSGLKHGGFRWTPSMGAWQGYCNQWILDRARNIAGQMAGE